jgi:1,4-dihydroxy-2-naphthoate octaprenyltransferase
MGASVGFWRKVVLWIKASRALYTITVLLPCCLGAVVSWQAGAPFQGGLLALILVGMMFANIGTNFTNDYFDYRSGVDKRDRGRVYKQGAEVLYDNPLAESGSVDGFAAYFFSPRAILASALAAFAVTAAVGLYLTFRIDWRILPVGLVGIAAGFFYTAPPLKFGYRGFGDLICFLGSGPFPVLGTYFLFTGRLSWTAALAGIVAGLWVDAILYIGNVPDAEADRAVGKTTLSTLLGRRAVRVLAPLYYGLATVLLVIGVAARLFPVWALLALAPLPIVARVLVLTRRHYDDIPRFAPAILLTVQVFALSTVLLAVGFILDRLL